MSMETLLMPLVMALSGGLMMLIAWASKKWAVLVDAKVKNDYLNGALQRLGELAATVVMDLQQSVVDKLREEDKWTLATAKQVKEMAMANLKAYMGVDGLKKLMDEMGLDDASLEKFLSSMIEAQVKKLTA